MDEHVNHWIGAYLDGELGEDRRRQVEAHLGACPDCRREMEDTRKLSSWLHGVPLPQRLPSAGDFAASLAARLPERPQARAGAGRWTTPSLGWWLVPLGILSGWLAVQILLLLPEWIQALLPLGISNAALAWLAPGPSLGLWAGLIFGDLPQEVGATVISLLEFGALWQAALLRLGLDALAALLFMSWLAGLAARRIHLAHQWENG